MSVATATKTGRKRGEGQWALGYREPLNKNEENKRNDDGLNVRQRILDIYSRYGFDSIDPADLRGRFRWYGLYTQRRPGIDGGKTAVRVPPLLDAYALSICSADFNEWVWKTTSIDAGYSYMLTPEYDMLEFDFANVVNYSDLASLMAPRPFMVERGKQVVL